MEEEVRGSNGVTTVDLTSSARRQTSNYQDAIINRSGVATGIAAGSVTITGSYSSVMPATTTLNCTQRNSQEHHSYTGESDDRTEIDAAVCGFRALQLRLDVGHSFELTVDVQTNINATLKGVMGSILLTVN